MTHRSATGVRAVIFDMDGVLIDTEPLFQQVAQRAARDLGRRLRDNLFAELSGLPETRVAAALHDDLGHDFDLEAFNQRCAHYWGAHVAIHGIAEKPGAAVLLDALAARGCPYAVATSTRSDRARHALEIAGLGARIAVLVGGEEVTSGKPAPDIFLCAAARLGARAGLRGHRGFRSRDPRRRRRHATDHGTGPEATERRSRGPRPPRGAIAARSLRNCFRVAPQSVTRRAAPVHCPV